MLKHRIKSNRLIWALLKPLVAAKSRLMEGRAAKMRSNFISSVIGGEVCLRAKNIPGTFTLSATSDIARRIIFDAAYEPDVTEALTPFLKYDGVIVNVGANVGLFAVFFAHSSCASKVIAIEPNPEAFRLLSTNLRTNGVGHKVEAINTCIGAQKDSVEFTFIEGKPEYSSVGGIVHPSVSKEQVKSVMIPQIPLDEVVFDPVSLIFVDVEGAEELVFRGAESILVKYRPVLFFECSDTLLRKFGCSSSSLHDYLGKFGYELRNALAPALSISHPFEGEVIAKYRI